MLKPLIDDAEKQILLACLNDLHNWVAGNILTPVSKALGGVKPAPMQVLIDHIGHCRSALESKPNGPAPIDAKWFPILKRALILRRRDIASLTDTHRERTSHTDLVAELDARVAPLDDLIKKDGVGGIKPIAMPCLMDFLNIRAIQETVGLRESSPRIYDEKFHLLQSPRLFLDDLDHFRSLCDMRARPLTVAFLDIDDFKKFNTKYGGEVAVDRNLLVKLMMEMEGHVFNRGFAYRFGGDEYVFLLPNYGRDESVTILRQFQEQLANIQFTDICSNPTVSIGLCQVDQDCHLTNAEILEAADVAKNFAKEEGKNRIAEAMEPSFGPGDLRLAE